ncbi:hypothetical protein [Komagataeibacter xylinus]|uniref:hypothetical protein n=1 Tax=Komagataeibacter xylinus TaxID=28448 RepID=UPI0010308F9E|nr:hypothetical protein [Komagataeibacter xylinus]
MMALSAYSVSLFSVLFQMTARNMQPALPVFFRLLKERWPFIFISEQNRACQRKEYQFLQSGIPWWMDANPERIEPHGFDCASCFPSR